MRRLIFAGLAIGLSGCATNFAERAAVKCADSSDPYCVQQTEAEMRQQHRRTWNIIAAGLGGAARAPTATPVVSEQPIRRTSGILRGEFMSGMNKVCVYRGLSGDEYVTVSATTLCPLSR